MSFYKTNNQDTLSAIDAHHKERAELRDLANSFAKRFGTDKYLILRDVHGYHFGGLKFDPARDRRFWSVPDRQFGTQYPRKNVPGMTADEKASHKVLLTEWEENVPKLRPSLEPIYSSIGTDWGNLLFAGIGWFLHDGFLYLETTAKLADHVTEILGSEFKAAENAFNAAQKKGQAE